MPMLEGTVQIDPATGSVLAKEGVAGEVFDELDGSQDYGTLSTTNPPAYGAAREQIAAISRAVAKVIPHIVTNAVVSTSVAVTSVSGVTTGPSASGPGTGSGTGTVA